MELCFTLCQSLYLRQRRMSFQASSRGTRNRSAEMLTYVISTYTFKLQGSIARNPLNQLLTANSFLLYILQKTVKPVAVALSPAVGWRNSCSVETECTSYLLCESVCREAFLGTERVPIICARTQCFPSCLWTACGLQRQALHASVMLCLCSLLLLSWAVSLLPECGG